MKFIGYNFLALCALAASVYLLASGRGYWGWFLFLAFVAAVTPSTED